MLTTAVVGLTAVAPSGAAASGGDRGGDRGAPAPVVKDFAGAFLTSGLRAGATHDVTGLAPGTHKFQCLIHPWMRTTVVVQAQR